MLTTLRQLSKSFQPSRVRTEVLRPHEWSLVGVAKEPEDPSPIIAKPQQPVEYLSPERDDSAKAKPSFNFPSPARSRKELTERQQARALSLQEEVRPYRRGRFFDSSDSRPNNVPHPSVSRVRPDFMQVSANSKHGKRLAEDMSPEVSHSVSSVR